MRRETNIERVLLRPAEVAEALGLAKSTAYYLIARGQIPSVRIGKAVRVPAAALAAWVEERTREAIDAKRS